ncbi:MAG: hypothetical protein WBF53_05165 [Litorimonas sp.]
MTHTPHALAASLAILATLWTPLSASAQITFQDVFENPDDQDLNLAYARQQIEAGELDDAAASLERMLFFTPNWDSARLLYATVLYDLDDRAAAQRELDILTARPLSPGQRAVAQRYADAIAGRRADLDAFDPTGLSGRLALSARYDDNAGGVFGDVVFGNQDASDESLGLSAALRYTADLSGDASLLGHVGASAQIRRHEDISDADFDVYGLEAGLAKRSEALLWRAALSYRDVSVGGEDYLQQAGGSMSLGVDVSETLMVHVQGGWYDRDFDDVSSVFGASGRTGELAEVGLGLTFTPTQALRVRATALYQDVSAEQSAFRYDGPRLSGDVRYRFNDSAYASGSVLYRKLNYDEPSVLLFPVAEREDEQLSLRGAVGFGLGGWLPGAVAEGVTLELAVNHSARDTNLPNANFDNTGGEVRLILDF